MGAVLAVLSLVLVLIAVLVVGLLRSHAEILRRLHELGAGLDPDAPTLRPARFASRNPLPLTTTGRDRAGAASSLELVGKRPGGGVLKVSLEQEPTLLAFLTSGCAACMTFWDAFSRELAPGLRVVIVTKDPAEESEARLRQLAPPDLTVVMTSDAWRTLAVPVSPYFVMLVAGRVVGEGAASGWAQLLGLIRRAEVDSGEEAIAADQALAQAGIRPGHPSLHP